MFKEINGEYIDLSKINRVGKDYNGAFSFYCSNHVILWPTEFREELIQAIKEMYPQ